MVYKHCIVPQCRNTTIKTPEKLFVPVPMDPKTRKKWLELARREPKSIGADRSVSMCEDHFEVENDVANYMKYKMGFAQKILMKDGVLPKKFSCQLDRKRSQTGVGTYRGAFVKRQRMEHVSESIKEYLLHAKTCEQSNENVTQQNISAQPEEIPKTQDKETITDTTLSPTLPFKIKLTSYHRASKSTVKKPLFLEDDRSDSHVSSFTEGVVGGNISSSVAPSSSRDSDSNVTETTLDINKIECLKNMLRLIHKKPSFYIGISNECYFIVNLIQRHTNIKIDHILLCLKKIRLDSTFLELEDNFGIPLSYASKIFLKNIPVIASVLRPFIVEVDKQLVKKNLPVAFRHNYHNVSCVIDCLEIDIQKPSKALHQALTWSEYKKGNTVKYLISCTPNGLVNYISPGFGGQTSDVTIIENCDFFDGLQQGSFVLADRGFKHIEQALNEKGIKLLRPPSVTAGSKLSKAEVRQTKIIASLRIHIERVIGCLREFHMLKQHSVINSNILRVLDQVIVIACALINLQDSLIK